ncbi:Fe-S cluster assembly protein SufB [Candidatus Peregrinibacteria bacterium]|nr:Fe-S cluster assembly protein SufB [Candidatus Peregrinibacteria bacterium]
MSVPVSTQKIIKNTLGEYKFGFKTRNKAVFKTAQGGLTAAMVKAISNRKKEPKWMLDYRLKALEIFEKKPMPAWGGDLSGIDFKKIHYYLQPQDRPKNNWEDVPKDIKDTFEKLGIPEAERKFLAGTGAQFESEVIYHSLQKELTKKGVVFESTDIALQKYPEIFRQYFGKVIPAHDNKFAALNSAVWSGGSFIYVPKGVHIELPLQAYFRINAENMGQFERTLIIADEGSSVHYVEGCLPAGELVSNGHKFTNIEAVKTSDLIVTDDGKHHKVKALMTRPYKGTMLKIIPVSRENSFRLTTEHPVLCIQRKINWLPEVSTKKLMATKPEYIPAGKLKKGDFIVYTTPTKTEDNEIFTEDLLKILGLYLAEGSISFNKSLKLNALAFSFGKKESEKNMAEDLILTIKKLGHKASITKSKGLYYTVISYSKNLIDLCLTHCDKGAHHKKLSQTIMELPVEKQKILLKNYLKGDGSVYIRKDYPSKMIRAGTASKTLAFQLQEIIARMGIYANISLPEASQDVIGNRIITRQDQYIVEYTENKKFNEVRRKDNNYFVPIKEIKSENYNGFVFNLEVKETNSYLVKGFAVHNCTAPTYSTNSLHSAVVEIIVKKGARVQYTTIQNWSHNVYNLVTKRAFAYRDAEMFWLDCNLGSKLTMKYPAIFLMEPGARGEVQSLAFANKNQHQDAGAKIIHNAPNTTSKIVAKSISKGSGRSSYRGLLKVTKGARNIKSHVSCDALLLDGASRSDTYPTMKIEESEVAIAHEATVSKIGEEQLFYLMSRGLTEEEAASAIVNGFAKPIIKQLPMEYALELNRLLELEMTGSVG